MGVTLLHLALLAPLALYRPLPSMPPAQPAPPAPPASHLVLQVMEVVINGLEMAPVMIQTTLKPAHLMVETVVDLT
jgi:hypothetical protein